MALYSLDGKSVDNIVYNVIGDSFSQAYDVGGNELFDQDPPSPVTPLSWNMSDTYKEQVLSALEYIRGYRRLHSGAYVLCQFNDVHTNFSGNEPNFIDYNKGYEVVDRMIFVGDMVNTSSASQYADAVSYMSGAQASKRLVMMGNHEYGSYSAANGNPETLYKSVINVPCVFKTDDLLIYYHDDENNNVRFIALNYFYIKKTLADNGHLLDMDQLNWLADVLENSGNKDIIISAHSMLNPFLGLESGNTLSSSATLQNYQNLIDVIVVYKQRGTYSVTVDGVEYAHDFSECTGKFVMYTTGHYHALGYGDFGFNMFTCPTLGKPYGGSHRGFIFYLIDKANSAIKVIQCSSQLSNYISFDYSY